jgi:hypothetical protein
MSEWAELALRVGPGDGLVARHGEAVLVLVGIAAGQRRVAEELLDMTAEAAAVGGDLGRRLSRQVAGVIAREEPEAVPSFCLMAPASTGTAVVVHGDAEVVVHAPGSEERISGRGVATWVDRIIDTSGASFVMLPVGAQGDPAQGDPAQLDPRMNLVSGVVSGGFAALVPVVAAAPAAPAAPFVKESAEDTPEMDTPEMAAPEMAAAQAGTESQPEPDVAPVRPSRAGVVGAPSRDGSFVSVSLMAVELEGPEEQRAPLPIASEDAQDEAPSPEPTAGGGEVIVRGIMCSRGHFNHPMASYCAACGISMIHITHNLVDGPRRPLGVLVFDDGATYTLDADYVVGREPENDPTVASGKARPLVIDDPDRSISRVHAAIVLDGWDASIADRGSANGTSISAGENDPWTRLEPDHPVPLMPGNRVMLGKRTMVYDSRLRR